MNIKKLGLVLPLLAACAAQGEPESEQGGARQEQVSEQLAPGDVQEIGQGLFVVTPKIWHRPIPVCWVDDGFDMEKQWVRAGIYTTWEAVSSARFVGWGKCTNQQLTQSGAAVRLKFVDGRGASQIGTDAAYGQVWTRLSRHPTGYCDLWVPWEDCVRKSAVHEFGHVLGFNHEHVRPDADPPCPERDSWDNPDPYSDWVEGPYDLQSIMNYCRTEDPWRPFLSYWDVKGVRAFYGRDGWAVRSALFDPAFYVDRYPELRNQFGDNREEATIHWLSRGLPREGRRGSAAVDLQYYLARYADLAQAYGTRYVDAANHWLNIGLPREGRASALEFDVSYYKSYWSDIGSVFASSNEGALQHWVSQGMPIEARRGSAYFDVGYYRNANSDLVRLGYSYRAALIHWIQFGKNEGRRGVP
jgi:Astacin (Peptidase family M12A)